MADEDTERTEPKPRARLVELRIEELSGVDRPCHAPATVALMKRAARKSTPDAPPRTVTTSSQENIMDPKDEKIAALEAEVAELKAKMAETDVTESMDEEEKAHDATLAPSAQKAYRAKPATERKALAKAAREVVYTSKASGEVYRKSDDPRLVSMAKAADAQAEAIAKRDEVIEKAEIRSLAKGLIGKLAGDDATHDFIVASLRKGGGSADQLEKAYMTLRAGNALATDLAVAKGASGEAELSDAQGRFDGLVAKHVTDHKVEKSAATVAILKTAEGKRLYAEINR